MVSTQDFKQQVRTWLAENQRSRGWLAGQVGVTMPHIQRWLNPNEDWVVSTEIQERIALITGLPKVS